MVTAKQIMATEPLTVMPETLVLDFAKKIEENHQCGAAVVDSEGNLVGVVTESDLIDQHKRLHLPTVVTLFDSVLTFGGHKVDDQIKKMVGATVADIMSSDLITVEENTPLEEVATIMAEKKKHFIPVMKEGKLAGVIDRAHVIQGIVKEG